MQQARGEVKCTRKSIFSAFVGRLGKTGWVEKPFTKSASTTHTYAGGHTPSNASLFGLLNPVLQIYFEEWSEIKKQGLGTPKGRGEDAGESWECLAGEKH